MKNISKKFYLIYQLKNKINGNIYIGKHKTDNLNDGYMGSGKIISKAIKKYGIENFEKTYLFIFDNEKEMNSKEREIVNEEFIARNDTYNLVLGGHGGGREPGYIASEETKLKLSIGVKKHFQENPPTDEYRQKLSMERKQRFIDNPELRNEYAIKTKDTWKNQETRQKRIEGQKRWYREVGLTEEQKNKLRVPHSKEWSEKISIALKGKPKSAEHRKHLSESRKGKPSNYFVKGKPGPTKNRIRVYNPSTKKWKYIRVDDPMPEGFSIIPISMKKPTHSSSNTNLTQP